MSLRFLSVCSGIEAASEAWKPLGWTCAAVAEIDPFPCHVLAHRHRATAPMFMPDPDAPSLSDKDRRARASAIKAMSTIPQGGTLPNFGDLSRFKEWPDADVNVLVGGTPCQSFSVAGLRKGLDDPRGNLALTYLAVAARYRPRWVVWENVPGVLSSNGGRDFGAFLGGLGQLGYGWSYRVLDAQYVRTCGHPFAVPQRRRRVFVVGYLGDWRPAAAALFDAQSLRGDSAPRREAGQAVAGSLSARTQGGGGLGTDFECDGGLVPQVANPLTARRHKGVNTTMDEGQTMVAHSLRGEGSDASEDGTGGGKPGQGQPTIAFDCKGTEVQYDDTGAHPPLRAMGGLESHSNAGGHAAVAFDLRGREGGAMPEGPHDTANLRAASGGSSRSYVAAAWAVRRLSCRECERLQGFEDSHTDVPYRGRNETPDGPRYKALGNSMAVNVMEWIGARIALVEDILGGGE